MRGREVVFHTAVAVVQQRKRCRSALASFPRRALPRVLRGRRSSPTSRAEQPYDCAGSAKIEGLGIALRRAARRRRPDGARRPAADRARRDARRSSGVRRPAARRERRDALSRPDCRSPRTLPAASVPVPVRGRFAGSATSSSENPKRARAFLKALGYPRPLASLAIERRSTSIPMQRILAGLLAPLLAGQDARLAVGGGMPRSRRSRCRARRGSRTRAGCASCRSSAPPRCCSR